MDSVEFCSLIVRDADVALSPGVGFGPGGEGFVRFALIENEKRIRRRSATSSAACPSSAERLALSPFRASPPVNRWTPVAGSARSHCRCRCASGCPGARTAAETRAHDRSRPQRWVRRSSRRARTALTTPVAGLPPTTACSSTTSTRLDADRPSLIGNGIVRSVESCHHRLSSRIAHVPRCSSPGVIGQPGAVSRGCDRRSCGES